MAPRTMILDDDAQLAGSDLWITVLGDFTITAGGTSVRLPAGRAELLCRRLLAARGARVSIDAVLDALWPDQLPENGMRLVGPLVSRLRAILGADRIQSCVGGWRFVLSGCSVDLFEAERLASRAATYVRAESWVVALRAAERALMMLTRGEAFVDELYAEWAQPAARRAAAMRRCARRAAWIAWLALDEPAQAESYARDALDEDQYDEEAARALMVSLAQQGRRAHAIDVYRALRSTLATELDVEPAQETETMLAFVMAPQAGRARVA